MNNLQKNPSNAAEDPVHPDWNSKAGEGTSPEENSGADAAEVYRSGKEGAKERQAGKNPPS